MSRDIFERSDVSLYTDDFLKALVLSPFEGVEEIFRQLIEQKITSTQDPIIILLQSFSDPFGVPLNAVINVLMNNVTDPNDNVKKMMIKLKGQSHKSQKPQKPQKLHTLVEYNQSIDNVDSINSINSIDTIQSIYYDANVYQRTIMSNMACILKVLISYGYSIADSGNETLRIYLRQLINMFKKSQQRSIRDFSIIMISTLLNSGLKIYDDIIITAIYELIRDGSGRYVSTVDVIRVGNEEICKELMSYMLLNGFSINYGWNKVVNVPKTKNTKNNVANDTSAMSQLTLPAMCVIWNRVSLLQWILTFTGPLKCNEMDKINRPIPVTLDLGTIFYILNHPEDDGKYDLGIPIIKVGDDFDLLLKKKRESEIQFTVANVEKQESIEDLRQTIDVVTLSELLSSYECEVVLKRYIELVDKVKPILRIDDIDGKETYAMW